MKGECEAMKTLSDRRVPVVKLHVVIRTSSPELPVIALNMIFMLSKFHHTSIVKASI